jgi:hypothetical protein
MPRDVLAKTRIAALISEIDGIHFVNSMYWGNDEEVTYEARVAHELRKQRLEKIRTELYRLKSS